MSVNESTESTETVYQTPGSSEEASGHEELEPSRPEQELSASPELVGPVTRSGKKRKNPAPVKSSGKKKNKTSMMRSPRKSNTDRPTLHSGVATPTRTDPPPLAAASATGTTSGKAPPEPQGQQGTQADLAALLTNGLSTIHKSMEAMENRITDKIGGLEATVASNKHCIVELTSALSKNTVDLARLETQMREGEANFESRVSDVVRSVMSADLSRPLARELAIDRPPGRHLTTAQIDRYDRCRRSLRLWPIGGPDLPGAVRNFLISKLGFDPVLVERDFGPLEARRVVEPRSKIESEVVVEFPLPAIRDSVKSHGFKLEGMAAGIRIEVPAFLKSDFHILQNMAYKIKQANKEAKRSIKFDDDCHGVMLDIQLPGMDWRRIRPHQAREARRNHPSLASGPLEMSADMLVGAAGGDSSLSLAGGSWTSASAASGSNSVPLGERSQN